MTDEAYRTEHFSLDERTAQSARDVMDILVGNALVAKMRVHQGNRALPGVQPVSHSAAVMAS